MATEEFSPLTQRTLHRKAVEKQVADRAPGLYAGVARRGVIAWSAGVGSARLGEEGWAPDADTRFSIASNTKTFVAVAIMALRDEGKLSLDDDLTVHVPESAHAGVTIRQLLAHVSGMQREPVGDVWETLEFPDRAGLVVGWNEATRVGRPHLRHHYSNLSYAMLGEVLCRVDGAERWFDVVERRILQPLGMSSTTLGPAADPTANSAAGQQDRIAGAYFVPPWTDVPRAEPHFLDGAFGAAGALWSTPTDLARWGGFVADPVEEVLSPDTFEEMCEPLVMAHGEWELAWGLGFMLWRRGKQVLVGHTGAYPGSITGVFTHRASATTGLAWANNSSAVSPGVLAVDLASYAVEHEPTTPEVWVPGETVPTAYEGVVGPWYSEGRPFTFSVRQGRLEATAPGQPAWLGPSVFVEVGPDRYLTVKGRERGEELHVRRNADGEPIALSWATYLFTRQPMAFGEWKGLIPPR